MSETTIYEVKCDVTRGSIQGESLWWIRSEAVAAAKRLARHMADCSKRRTLEQDDHDPERWHVREVDERWPDEKGQVFVSYYVSDRIVKGSAVDRLAAVSESSSVSADGG